MNVNKRLEKLEAAARPKGKALLVVEQDPDNPDIFTDREGNTYTDQELKRLDGSEYENIIRFMRRS